MPRTEELVVIASQERLAATKVCAVQGRKPAILSLHELGPQASRHAVRYLLDPLAGRGHASISFEFSGNGDSTGVFAASTLRRRRDETLAVARYLGRHERPVLVGTGMGGHLAAWLAPVLRPRALVLFCPVAYPGGVADQPFDGGLPCPAGVHADSPAYAGIAEFTGDLLVVGARSDEVVSAAAVGRYLESARQARSKRLLWLDGCGHAVHRWLPGQAARQEEVLRAMLQAVTGADEAMGRKAA